MLHFKFLGVQTAFLVTALKGSKVQSTANKYKLIALISCICNYFQCRQVKKCDQVQSINKSCLHSLSIGYQCVATVVQSVLSFFLFLYKK
jgi:hypothetical protein